MSRKASNGTGTVERRGALWWVRVPLPGTKPLKRKRIPIEDSEKMTRAEARRAGARKAEDVRAGRIVFDEAPSATGERTTVAELHKEHVSGKLLERYGKVNRLRAKAEDNAYIERVRFGKHALPVKTRGPSGPTFGDLPVASVKPEDCEQVMASLAKEAGSASRMHIYVQMRRLFDLAVYPVRIRTEGSNPVSRYLRPSADPEKLFCFMYPSEVITLLGCETLPLARRVLYAIAVYTGQRKGSLFALHWKHVDFDHGTLASFKTKTGRAQYFVADHGLMAVLEAWHRHLGRPGDDEPIVAMDTIGCDPKALAPTLQGDLRAAGITRSILFEREADNVEALRFHDLRSTFCTWARRLGKSNAWISERTGHEPTGDMINRYDRGATTLDDLAYEPFPDITRAVAPLAPPPLASGGPTGDGGDSTGSEPTSEDTRENAGEFPTMPPGCLVAPDVAGSRPVGHPEKQGVR